MEWLHVRVVRGSQKALAKNNSIKLLLLLLLLLLLIIIIIISSIRTAVSQLYAKFDLLPIDKLKLVYKCIYCRHLVPSVYIDCFVANSDVYNYNTRSSQKLHLTSTRTSYVQKCIKYKSSLMWNSLPFPLRFCPLISVF